MARRKGSLINKAINLGLLWVALARPLQVALIAPQELAVRASMGLTQGRFDKGLALDFYGGMIGALVAFEAKKVIMAKLGRNLPF